MCRSLPKVFNSKYLILIVITVSVFMDIIFQPTGNVSTVVRNRLSVKGKGHFSTVWQILKFLRG